MPVQMRLPNWSSIATMARDLSASALGTRKMVTIEAKVGAPDIKLRAAGRAFAEIYRDLKPGEAVPQAVLDADLRHHELMLQQAAERPVVPAAEETPVRPTTPT